MANSERGEVSIEIGGKAYTLALTINAMVALEDQFSTPMRHMTFDEITRLADRGSVKHFRAYVWAALQEHHPDLTQADVGKLMRDPQGVIEFAGKLQQLAKASSPDKRDLEELGVKLNANPPQARAKHGTGERSTSRPVMPA